MKFNEAIDMTKQKLPDNWIKAKTLWNVLVNKKEVYPTDHEGFLSFEKFYSSFLKKENREPTVQETLKIFLNKSQSNMRSN